MNLLDTTEEIEPLFGSHEPYVSHAPLLREHRKLEEAVSGEDKIRRLVRIQKIVKALPSTVPAAMEFMLKFHAQGNEREVALQIREVLLDCLIHMIEWPSSMDPDLCAGAMDILARIDFPNDRAFLLEMDSILLGKFPHSYSVHRHIQERQLEAAGETFRPVEANSVQTRALRALKELEHRTGTTLLNGDTIDIEACKPHTELPSEMLRLAAFLDLKGDVLEALNIFQAMMITMRSRLRFNEYASFLVHYRELLYRRSVAPQIINDEGELHACQYQIKQVDKELSAITGGWKPDFPGTEKTRKMIKTVEGNEYAGAPLYGQREVHELVAALNVRMKQGLPN